MSCQQEPWGCFPNAPRWSPSGLLLFHQISVLSYSDSFNSKSNLVLIPKSYRIFFISIFLNWHVGCRGDKSEWAPSYLLISNSALQKHIYLSRRASASKTQGEVRTMIHPPRYGFLHLLALSHALLTNCFVFFFFLVYRICFAPLFLIGAKKPNLCVGKPILDVLGN